MAITFNTNKMPSAERKIWRGEAKMLPAGFKPKQTFVAGTIFHRGTPLFVDMSDLSAAICKVAKVIAGGTTTKPRITKNSYLQVGDKVMVDGGSVERTISAIDTSNSGYDELTLNSALTGATEGAFITESLATTEGQTTTYSPKYVPNCIIGEDREVMASDLPTIDAAWGALVIKDVAPAIPDSWMAEGGLCLKNNHNIVYIRQ